MLIINKLNKVDNVNRKLIHVVSAFIIVIFPYVFNLTQIILISLLFSLIFYLSKLYGFLPIINRVRRTSWGEVLYPIGVLLAAVFFLPDNILAFQFGILVLGVSDALANIIGETFVFHPIYLPYNKKSIGGSMAFFVSSFFLFLLMSNSLTFVDLALFIVAALFLTLLEFLSVLGLDNLFLPVSAAYLFTLLS